jgi:hypothetical protein
MVFLWAIRQAAGGKKRVLKSADVVELSHQLLAHLLQSNRYTLHSIPSQPYASTSVWNPNELGREIMRHGARLELFDSSWTKFTI